MTSEPDLRRRVDVTRQLVQTAAQLPPAGLPRNFTLPASMGKPSAPPTTLWWRVGSAVAAAVFVFAVGLDISGILAPQSFAVQATSAPAATSLPDTTGAASSEMAANAAPTESGAPTPEGTPAPLMMSVAAVTETITDTTQAYGAGGGITEITETPPAISAKQPVTDTTEISVADTAAMTQAQRSAVNAEPSAMPETPVAAAAPPAEQPAPVPQEPPWLLIVAGISLALAVGMGIAGWARR